MSITIRLWSKKELQEIENRVAGKNLMTVFMNVNSFSESEIKVYPYDIRQEYKVTFGRWYEGEYCFPVNIYAVDDESALWFISKEYHTDAVKTVSRIIYNENGLVSMKRIKIIFPEGE